MRIPAPFIAAFLASTCCAASAAESGADETIVVTATRTDLPLSDAIVPITVIDREDIELSMAADLAELLRVQAGIDIGRSGGPGQSTSIFLRGAESNHTLVLVDGVRINPGTIGGAPVEHLAPELIERVEIVKGARSALFGTDAIGGVVNIITRRADRAFVETGLGAGSFDTRSGFVSGGNHGRNGEFGVSVNWQDTDGYAPRTDSDIERGYDNLSMNLYGARRFGTNEFILRHWQAKGTVEYLDFFLNPVDQDFRTATTAAELNSTIGDDGSSKFIASFMSDEISQNQSEDFVESQRISLDWQYSHEYSSHTVTGGLYYVDENASSLSFGSGFDEDTAIRAAFVQDQWSHDRHRAFLALRVTDHESFGNHTTWNAEYAFLLNGNWTLNAGLGHAFRAPDATDRFGFGGNPELGPELADETQLGIRYSPDTGHSLALELYAKNIDDLIEFDFETYALRNIAKTEIRGAQLAYGYRGERFVVQAELTRQRAEDASTGERLLRRADESASISYTQMIGPHRLGIAVIAAGDRKDIGGVTLDGYVVANLVGTLALGEAWTVHARVENLFDTEYQTAADYRMQQLSAFVELQYAWN
jgi:vitamin B12 transporter